MSAGTVASLVRKATGIAFWAVREDADGFWTGEAQSRGVHVRLTAKRHGPDLSYYCQTANGATVAMGSIAI